MKLELAIGDELLFELGERLIFVDFDTDPQHAFGFTAQHGEQAVRRDFRGRFAKLEVHFKLSGFFLFAPFDLGGNATSRFGFFGEPSARVGLIGPRLGNDIESALKCGGWVGYFQFQVNVLLEYVVFRPPEYFLAEEQIGQRLQSTFTSDGSSRTSFGFEGQVDCFEGLQISASDDLFSESVGQESLFVDGFEDSFFASGQFAGFFEGIFDSPECHFIETLGGFFAVACDEGNGVSGVQEFDGGMDLAFGNGQGNGNLFCHGKKFNIDCGIGGHGRGASLQGVGFVKFGGICRPS